MCNANNRTRLGPPKFKPIIAGVFLSLHVAESMDQPGQVADPESWSAEQGT